MATKIYRMNLKRNYARLIIKGKAGNEVIYEFNDGNPVNSTPARCILNGEYEQDLLEDSEYFEKQIVTLERVIETEEDKMRREAAEAERKAKQDAMKKENDIKSVTEAIAYVAEHFDEKAVTARQALQIAEKNGVTFPNLKLGKK